MHHSDRPSRVCSSQSEWLKSVEFGATGVEVKTREFHKINKNTAFSKFIT